MEEHSDLNHLSPLMSTHNYWLQGTVQGTEDSSARRGGLVWCH
uniref:Uncharacterized protein n=1 Tax=Arundo donax TaxID=35708 RepID=A0A0A9DFQ2_ARUDO